MMENEKWVEVNPGMIPPGDYSMRLQTGDFENLIVFLKSISHEISLDFLGDISFHCVDEANWLFYPYEDREFEYYRRKQFDNVLYRICNGKYDSFTKKYMGDLFEYEKPLHYIIISLNFFVEVITKSDINVTVKSIETGECKQYMIERIQI